ANEHEAAEAQPGDERFEVTHVRPESVVGAGCPRRVAVSPLVERQATVLVPEREAHEGPGARSLATAVEEEDGRTAGCAPVGAVEDEAAEGEAVGFRAAEFVDREGCNAGRSAEVRELLRGRGRNARLGRRALRGAGVPDVDGEGRRRSRRKRL